MNVIMHIPHASTGIPFQYKDDFLVDRAAIEGELAAMTDWYVDQLFENCPGKKIVFGVSRLVCDVERFASDEDEPMAKRGMGVCYTKDHNLKPFKAVSNERRQEIVEGPYKEHHDRLTCAVQESLDECGRAMILDCHSFASKPYACDFDQSENRPEICLGIDAFHTPAELVTFTCGFFRNAGFDVAINTPFSGTIVPMRYYNKDPKVFSLMIELNRSLYMDESVVGNLVKVQPFQRLQGVLCDYVSQLAEML